MPKPTNRHVFRDKAHRNAYARWKDASRRARLLALPDSGASTAVIRDARRAARRAHVTLRHVAMRGAPQ